MEELLTLITGGFVIVIVLSLYWQYNAYQNTSSLLFKLKKLEETVLAQQEKILSLVKQNNKANVGNETADPAIVQTKSDVPSSIANNVTDKTINSEKSHVVTEQPKSTAETITPQHTATSITPHKEAAPYAYQQAAKEESAVLYDKVSPIQKSEILSTATQPTEKAQEHQSALLTEKSTTPEANISAAENVREYAAKSSSSRFSQRYKDEAPQVISGAQQSAKIPPVETAKPQQENTLRKTNTVIDRYRQSKRSDQKSIFSLVWKWVVTGNPLAKIGMLLLFFGLSYLLKYSIENELISASTRLMMAGTGCLVLLGLGWWLRKKNLIYALILQGGGIGGLYITIFAATKIYDFIPIGFALGIMVFICLVSVALAVVNRAISLAVLASLGGYLAPILLSTGSGNYVALFSYYLILSIGILIISHWQVWRLLNLIGFAFTFGIAFIWAVSYYKHVDYVPCQLFLIANWFIFGVATEISTLKNKLKLNIPFDATLLFGTPLIGFVFQYRLASEWEYGVAVASSLYALAYFALCWFTLKRYREEGKLLAIAFFMLSVTFATLSVPFAFSLEWTTIVWAIEGVMILAFSVLQQQKKPVFAGTALIAVSFFLLFIVQIGNISEWSMRMALAVIMFGTALLWQKATFAHKENKNISLAILFIAVGSWVYSLFIFIRLGLDYGANWGIDYPQPIALTMILISCLTMYFVGKKTEFFELANCSALLWPVSALVMLVYLVNMESLIEGWLSALLWIAIFTSGFYLLKFNTNLPEQERVPKRIFHGAHLLFIAFFLFIEYVWITDEYYFQTSLQLSYGIIAICIFMAISYALSYKVSWIKSYQKTYWLISLPILGLLVFVLLFANLTSGNEIALYFIPLLNPMDIAGIIGLWIMYKSITLLKQQSQFMGKLQKNTLLIQYVIPLVIFWWANGVLLRGLVSMSDITWNYYAILNSKVIQTILAIVWTITALVIMLLATRRKQRLSWFIGGVLLAIVIAKLFLVDISLSSGLLRAAAFIGVAILILLIGYFSPLPPKKQNSEETAQK